MPDADLLAMPPAPEVEDDEQRRQRLLQLPLPNAIPPAPEMPANRVAAPAAARTAPAATATIPPSPSATGGPSILQPQGTASPIPPAPFQVPGYPQGEPKLKGWRNILDVVGSMFPIGRAIETAIPGTPQNYSERANVANERFNKAAARAAKGQEIQKGEQELQKGASAAQFDTPEKRRTYVQNNPDLFDNVSDFEKNDFILSGKFPQREPPPPKEDKKVDEGYNAQGQRVTVYQKPNGTIYNRVNPDIVQKPPEEANKLAGEIEAQIGAKPTTPEFGGKKYASVAEAQKAWGKEAERIKNEEASAAGAARGAGFGRNRPISVVDTWNGNRPVTVSAGEAEDNPDRYVTQSGAANALPKEALINDIRVGTQNLEKNLDILDAKGLDRVALAAALADPETTKGAYLQALPRGLLNDKGQQFVADLFTLRELAMSIRATMGNTAGAEDVRRAILQTLPSIASPNKGFAKKQLDNLLGVLERQQQGIMSVPLNTGSRGAGGGGAKGGFAEWDRNNPAGQTK